MDDIDLHSHAPLVRFVDEVLEAVRTAIGLLDGKKRHRVVTPTVPAVEFADRHERDHVHPEVAEIIQPLHRIVESRRLPVRGTRIVERPDVKLIHDNFIGKGRLESLVLPDKSIFVIDDGGLRTVDHAPDFPGPRILAPKGRAGRSGDDIFVSMTRTCIGHRGRPDIARGAFDQGIRRGAPIIELTRDGNLDRIRRPDTKTDTSDGGTGFVDARSEFLALAGRNQAPDQEDDQQERDAHSGIMLAGGAALTVAPEAHQKLCGTSIWSPGRRMMSRDGLERTALISTSWARPLRMRRTLRWSA